MNIHFEEFKNDVDTLVEFLTSDTWTYFGTPDPKPERIRKTYNDLYTGDNIRAFWIVSEQGIRAGMIRIYDLEDDTPLFDIRILSKFKGMGIGTTTVKWLVDYIFTNFPDKKRIEADTRQDNYAMRTVFHKCGFVREAHFRKAWPDRQNGKLYDAMGYSILKEDWENGEVTPIDWNDFKY